MAAFIITSDQEVPVAVSFADDHGNPATVNGAPVWTVSDATLLSVVAAADGMSAVVDAVGPDGQAQVTVTADADIDGSGTPIPVLGILDIQIVSGDAATAVMTPGTPVSNVVPAPTPAPTPGP
jgi:hypothetical protein